jgi:two-component system sensor histidine kinase KdpD
VVDELAHTNVPGSKHEKRYEDVMELLDGGISVISTLDVQHLESLNDYVEKVTGVAVHERVPDWVFDQAEQVELLDMAPEALIERMTHGDIYPPEQTRRALENFFTIGNLTVLRDLALRSTAAKVENNLDQYMRSPQIEAVAIGERVMVGVHHRPIGKALIRRGYRIAAAMKGELIAVYVEPTERRRQVQSVQEERQLRTNLELADELGAKVVRLRGKVSDELIAHARANHVSQLIIGSSMHGRRGQLLRGSVTSDILRKMPDIDIHVVGNRTEPRPDAKEGA